MNLPPEFINNMRKLIPGKVDAFQNSHLEIPPVSIRINPRKPFHEFDQLKPVPWCKTGYYLPHKPSFSRDPYFHGGGYYVQEASSMFLSHVLDQLFVKGNAYEFLDLCASPGGKSTILLDQLDGEGILMANDPISKRIPALKENLTKWGHSNYIVTQNDVREFTSAVHTFDLVLVDAPCSGEGLFRKDPEASGLWSLRQVEHCGLRQKRILSDAKKLIKPGGYIIYSTCTYNETENDHQVLEVLNDPDFKSVPIEVEDSWNIAVKSEPFHGYRFFPHRTNGEGFFLSVLKRNQARNNGNGNIQNDRKKLTGKLLKEISEWIDIPDPADHLWLNQNRVFYCPFAHPVLSESGLYIRAAGTELAEIRNQILKPAHALAQSQILHPSVPKIQLEGDDVTQYLKGMILHINAGFDGWGVANYRGLNLGWVKAIPGRINNHYPKSLRIN